MDVFIELWSSEHDLVMARKLADAARHNRPAALLSVVDSGHRDALPIGARIVMDPVEHATVGDSLGLPAAALDQVSERATDAIPGLVEIDDSGRLRPVVRIEATGAPRLFVDPISGAQRLVIAGAGHIAQPLATLGTMLGFHVTVIDDRAAFANRERFPAANEIIVRPFKAAIDSIRLDRHCYVISVTRGHAFDDEVVRAALAQAAREPGIFIGMIGSRRRVRATLERIEKDGVDPALLDEVHAPLGVDIRAETPEEIAVSIIGEVIRERRGAVRDDFNLGTKLGRLSRSAGKGSGSKVRRDVLHATEVVEAPGEQAAK